MKRQAVECEKIYAIHFSDKGFFISFVSHYYKKWKTKTKQKNQEKDKEPNRKMGKRLEQVFNKRGFPKFQ